MSAKEVPTPTIIVEDYKTFNEFTYATLDVMKEEITRYLQIFGGGHQRCCL